MNGAELFLLGRTLMKIGEEAIPTEGVGPRSTSTRSMLIVMLDVYAHTDTTVGEVALRTGLPQSAVSACVARLREAGSILTATDPADRRRSLIRRNPEITGRRAEVAASPIDYALGAALDTEDSATIAETVALLEQLAERLSPDVLGRLR
ncbi:MULTISPECIES: helix-turn-helix domain-containing protein [unclassified Streptomyces]|uniref:MarR family transcriptional regulator n=1 Tax=unclassified Streptomyces TaxID=2593676 RepID=UPI00224E8606|nr:MULTISPECIES: helix-turn-helix domain-containing protein [unclassified Streptomyces]MCX4992847.1 MarR family transcriptional regulator [Streptomyces sp. NBC_00568]MCX5001917.1 MarR family transcriptional regulator [Streptomyces sp. NBC_00638]